MTRIEKLTEFLVATPGDSFLQHALALEYIKLGDDDKAAPLFEEILSRDPGYVGSYYHLGKLLERTGKTSEAVMVYQKGMQATLAVNDRHAYSELQAALEDLEDN
jgi:Tfp pilus assembly protein PilF